MNNWEHSEKSGFPSVSATALRWLDELAARYQCRTPAFDALELSREQRRKISRGHYVDPFTGRNKRQVRILARGEVVVLVRARPGESGQFLVDLCSPDFFHGHHRVSWCWWWELELLLLLAFKE